MTVAELKAHLHDFYNESKVHRDLWNNSFEDGVMPEYAVSNLPVLQQQTSRLLRKLGLLRPYLEDLHSTWILTQMGVAWNVLDSAIGLNQAAHLKGPALNALVDASQIVLGRLDDYCPEAEFRIGGLTTANADIELAERICARVGKGARVLSSRRAGKECFQISDEYDVQDLVHAFFRAFFKYPVTENPLPKIAGAVSTRADLCIEELGLLVEVKFVRDQRDQKRIERDLAEDLVFYSAWGPLKYLFFLIFNSADLQNAELLDKFSKPQTINEKHFTAKVINV